jgi:hypothetical protein
MFSKIERNSSIDRAVHNTIIKNPQQKIIGNVEERPKFFPFLEIKDYEAESLFLQEKAVFKITSSTIHTKGHRDVFMVMDKDEYYKRLLSHQYSPLLNICPIFVKLAYLYECLNRKNGISRDEQFTFWWRLIGKDEWKMWFIVNPYND